MTRDEKRVVAFVAVAGLLGAALVACTDTSACAAPSGRGGGSSSRSFSKPSMTRPAPRPGPKPVPAKRHGATTHHAPVYVDNSDTSYECE